MPTNTPPPPTKKGEPPTRNETRRNLSKPQPAKIVALNFRVPAELKKEFKIASATNGITQSELLKQAFDEWKKRYG
jgi:hypothetical protein